MRIEILTLFPEAIEAMMRISIIGRARADDIVTINCHQIRDYTQNRQKQVDDYPYGGGPGMVMQADPLYQCLEHVVSLFPRKPHTVLLSPQSKPFVQADAKRLHAMGELILICGHYEGVDERFIEECVDEELSLGDFILTGGEIPAMAVCDAVCRLVPGVLAQEECFQDESYWSGLLEYPHYSRPECWHERRVPEVLISGHHANIERWRRERSLQRTFERRPDLLASAELSETDRAYLKELGWNG